MNRNICPICETGTLSKQVHTGEIQYRDRTIPVPNLEYSQCDGCGADPVLAEQAKPNQVRFSDASTCTFPGTSSGEYPSTCPGKSPRFLNPLRCISRNTFCYKSGYIPRCVSRKRVDKENIACACTSSCTKP